MFELLPLGSGIAELLTGSESDLLLKNDLAFLFILLTPNPYDLIRFKSTMPPLKSSAQYLSRLIVNRTNAVRDRIR